MAEKGGCVEATRRRMYQVVNSYRGDCRLPRFFACTVLFGALSMALFSALSAGLLATVQTSRASTTDHQFIAHPSIQSLDNPYTLFAMEDGLTNPVAVAFLPSGDALIAERGNGTGADGRASIRLVRNHRLQPEPVLTLSVNVAGSSGIHGMAVAPNVAELGYIYVYYATGSQARQSTGSTANGITVNRLARFTLNLETGVADPASELIVMDNLRWSPFNNGGALAFDNVGYLYIATGDTEQPPHARKLDRYSGKVLRIQPTDTGYIVPADNPFVNAREAYPEIFAYGFRNPTALILGGNGGADADGSRLFVADQGETNFDEVNELRPGGHYGWPFREGRCLRGQSALDSCRVDPRYLEPLAQHARVGSGQGITGLMYFATSSRYPSDLQDSLFFVKDTGNGSELYRIGPATDPPSLLAQFPSNSLRGLFNNNGYIYSLDRAQGSLQLLYFDLDVLRGVGASQPAAMLELEPTFGLPSTSVTLSATHLLDPKELGLRYIWTFGDGSPQDVTTEPLNQHVYQNEGVYRPSVQVEDPLGGVSELSSDTVTVFGGEIPDIVLENATEPGRDLYFSGDRFTFWAERESGVTGLSETNPYRWRIDLHHRDDEGEHVHMLSNFSEPEGLLRLRLTDEHNDSAELFYRFHLFMTTEEGLEIETFRDLAPETATLTVESQPGAGTLSLNQNQFQLPYTRTVVAGQMLTLAAPDTTLFDNGIGEFAYWHLYETEWPVTAAAINETIIYSPTTTIQASPRDTKVVAHYEYARPAEQLYLPLLSTK